MNNGLHVPTWTNREPRAQNWKHQTSGELCPPSRTRSAGSQLPARGRAAAAISRERGRLTPGDAVGWGPVRALGWAGGLGGLARAGRRRGARGLGAPLPLRAGAPMAFLRWRCAQRLSPGAEETPMNPSATFFVGRQVSGRRRVQGATSGRCVHVWRPWVGFKARFLLQM